MKFLYTLIASFIALQLFAQPGDTTIVQTFTFDAQNNTSTAYDNPGRRTFAFPASNNGVQYQKILMYHTLKCFSSGTAGGLGYPCGEWDYLTYNYLFQHTGQLDSAAMTHPHYLFANNDFASAGFSTVPTYNTLVTPQTLTVIDASTAQQVVVGSNLSNINGPMRGGLTGRTQYIILASELSAQGLVAGDIQQLQFSAENNGSSYGHFALALGTTSLSALSNFVNTGLTQVFYHNTDATPVVNMVFNSPWTWDGTSNLVLDFTYENQVSQVTPTCLGEMLAFNAALNSNGTDRYLMMDGEDKVDVPASAFDSIHDEITISFWIKGTAAFQPEAGTAFEGVNAGNQRVVNAHLPWSDSHVYWDAGNNSDGYDRIEKLAAVGTYEANWNHWAFTKNATTGIMKIFVNGVLWHTGTSKVKMMDDIVKFAIGGASSWTNYYRGAIDEFAIFNKALDVTTISQWMRKDITSAHPFYSNLQVYYQFDEPTGLVIDHSGNNRDGAILGDPQRLLFTPSELYRNISVSQERPQFTFGQGSFSTHTEQSFDSVLVALPAQSLVTYAIGDHDVVVTNVQEVYPAGYTYTIDENGTRLDSVLVESTILFNDTLSYYASPVERLNRFELGRFITPYGIQLDLQDGWTWIYDVTDFAPLLRDSVELEAGNWQELLDLKFLFIEGVPARDVTRIENVWQGNYGLPTFETNVANKTLSQEAGEEGLKLRTTITGHGFGNDNNNCGEFCYNTHSLDVNGAQQWSWEIIEECDQNPLYPQGGTWIFARAGWCPGKEGKTNEFELTPHLINNQVDVDYNITYDPYGNYVTESQAVHYGPINHQRDAAIDAILAPSKEKIYSRWNPTCDEGRIVIRNKGAQPLTSVTIHYGMAGQLETYTWTGNLAFDQSEEVALPIVNEAVWNDLPSLQSTFEVHLDAAGDEYDSNDHSTSLFYRPPVLSYLPLTDDNRMIIILKTNLFNQETSYKLYDINGNIVYERSDFPFTNTLYRDTIYLAPGCYQFHLIDTDGDGQSFFANDDGNGYCRLDRVNGIDFKVFETDFGQDIVYNFRWNTNILSVPTQTKSALSLKLRPNPVNESLKIRMDGFYSQVIVVIMDAQGRQVYRNGLTGMVRNEDYLINTQELESGMYFLTVSDANHTMTKKFVKE